MRVLFVAPGCFLEEAHIESSTRVLDEHYTVSIESQGCLAHGAQEVNVWREYVFITLHSTVAIYKTYRHIPSRVGQQNSVAAFF